MKRVIPFLLLLAMPVGSAGAAQGEFVEDWQSSDYAELWEFSSEPGVHGSVVRRGGPKEGCVSARQWGMYEYFMWMDSDLRYNYETNVMKTKYDFSGTRNLKLDFWTKETSDERHICSDHSGDFGDPSCDGVLFTCDGTQWHVLWQAPSSFSDWTHVHVDLSSHPDYCEEITSDFAIKFMQYDNFPCPVDGIGWDDITVFFDADILMGVIVDTGSYAISEAEIRDVVEMTSDRLYEKTGVGVQLQGIRWDGTWSGAYTEVHQYLDDLPSGSKLPHLMTFFHSNGSTRAYGGYSVTTMPHSSHSYCNDFESPNPSFGDGTIYGAIIDWDKRPAACGYDLAHYASTGNWVQVDTVSLDDGQCRGHAGLPCEYDAVLGYNLCSNVDEPYYFKSAEKAFVADYIVHELLHPFGLAVNNDHWGTPNCDTLMGDTSYRIPFSLVESDNWANMCPTIWEDFEYSYDQCDY